MIRIIKSWYSSASKSDIEQVTYSNMNQFEQDAQTREANGWELDPDVTHTFENHPWKYSQNKIAAVWRKKCREGENNG